jgi:hypothetical protein
MNGILQFLHKHKWISITAGSITFTATVLLHKTVANLSLDIERKVTYVSYNKGWGLFAIISLTLISLAVFIKIFKSGDKGFKILFLILTAVLIVAAHIIVLAVNLEYIHIMQFSLLVFPVFALSMRFGETVFWIGLMGTVDELYQYYVVWWPHQSYFDFNDITMDIVGGVFMLFLIYLWLREDVYFAPKRNQQTKWYKSYAPTIAAILILLALLANITGILRFYPQEVGGSDRQSIILLSNDPPAPQFWSVFEKGKIYHIQGALEWIALLILLTVLYSLLDWRFYKKHSSSLACE